MTNPAAVTPGARVGVVGAGTTGADIAEVAARAGLPVLLLVAAAHGRDAP